MKRRGNVAEKIHLMELEIGRMKELLKQKEVLELLSSSWRSAFDACLCNLSQALALLRDVGPEAPAAKRAKVGDGSGSPRQGTGDAATEDSLWLGRHPHGDSPWEKASAVGRDTATEDSLWESAGTVDSSLGPDAAAARSSPMLREGDGAATSHAATVDSSCTGSQAATAESSLGPDAAAARSSTMLWEGDGAATSHTATVDSSLGPDAATASSSPSVDTLWEGDGAAASHAATVDSSCTGSQAATAESSLERNMASPGQATVADSSLEHAILSGAASLGAKATGTTGGAGQAAADEAAEPLAAMKERETLEAIRKAACCPILHDLLQDPVVASDGQTYSRKALERWLKKHGTSPLTRDVLQPQLYPNRFAAQVVQQLQQASRAAATSAPGRQQEGAALREALRKGDEAAALGLLARPQAPGLNFQDRQGHTLLHRAIGCGLPAVALALLARKDFRRVNEKNHWGRTALHYAARRSYSAVCEAILERADFVELGAVNGDGATALQEAQEQGDTDVVELLVNAGRPR